MTSRPKLLHAEKKEAHRDTRRSYVSLFDVAAFAIRALQHPGARNTTIEIGGPESVAPLEIIRLFEQASGRPFMVDHVPEQARWLARVILSKSWVAGDCAMARPRGAS
jgi:uncharacterized protein YbjT (DUF2867 family)